MAFCLNATTVAKPSRHTPVIVSSPAAPNHHSATQPNPAETSSIPRASIVTIRISVTALNVLIPAALVVALPGEIEELRARRQRDGGHPAANQVISTG